jgi:site-specific DNA recombinase
MPAEMLTACYARFSSDHQRQTSLEDQARSCQEYAERHAWTWQPDHVYTDAALSGSSLEGRAGLTALLTAAGAVVRPFDVVLVDDSSRVARDLADALRVLQRLRFAGVRVVYISQGIDSASEQAETLVAVHGLVDGLYLREMAAKIRRGLAGQLERGYATGSATYGYRTIPVPDPSGRRDPKGNPAILGKRIEIDPAEAAITRRIFERYAAGAGIPRIVGELANVPGPRGGAWKFGAIRRLLINERLTGKQIWGQRRYERRPGSRHKVARPVPRTEWRIAERPDLRIIPDDLWHAVQRRLTEAGGVARQAGRTLMRGKNAALHSRHLFSGFLRCGTCGGAITVVSGGYGQPRYGCARRSKDGATTCANSLTIRAKVADAALLAGLQEELRRPETVQYLVDQVSRALNAVVDARPQQRDALIRQRDDATTRLANLVTAIEAGEASSTVFQAIRSREAEITALNAEVEALQTPIEDRLAVMPTWVRQQLEDVADLLAGTPDLAKREFQRLDIRFTVSPVVDDGPRPFLRAEGSGAFEHLAFSRFQDFTTTGPLHPR